MIRLWYDWVIVADESTHLVRKPYVAMANKIPYAQFPEMESIMSMKTGELFLRFFGLFIIQMNWNGIIYHVKFYLIQLFVAGIQLQLYFLTNTTFARSVLMTFQETLFP